MSYRWVVLVAGCVGTMVTGALRQGLPSLGPAFRDTFALSLGEVGFVFAAVAAGMTIALVPFGALADRLGERPVLAGGLAVCAGTLVLAALAESFGLLLAGLFLAGLFGASATGASGRAVMGWFAREERGLALGIRQTAIPLGGALAAFTLPVLAVTVSLDAALLALAGFTAVAALTGALLLRDPPTATTPRTSTAANGEPIAPPTRDARIWRLGLGSGLIVMAQAAVIGFVVLFLHDERGLSLGAAAAFLAAIQVGSAFTRIAIGRRSDRRGSRIVPLRQAGFAGAALLAAAAVLADAPGWLLLPPLLLGGVAISSWNGLAFTAAAELADAHRAGTAMSLQNTLVSVLGAVTPPLFGAFVDLTSYRAAYLAVALAPVAGALVLRPLVAEEARRGAGGPGRSASLSAHPTPRTEEAA